MYLQIAQIIVSIIIVVLVLLQERSAGLSGIFGGESSGVYQTRRGLEKFIFAGTIIFSIVFVLLALWQLAH